MTEHALIGAGAEASGHPSECQDPVPGTVESSGSHDVTVTVDGQTKELATEATSTIEFGSHAHQYSDIDDDGNKECHDYQSHSIDPSSPNGSITINGSPIYSAGDSVGTDPVTGGDVVVTSNPFTTDVTES